MEIQLAECYQTLATDRTLAVELPPAQTQQGGVDCGLFAIAFAYELADGMTRRTFPLIKEKCVNI